jgi:hypothetical protein
MVSRRRFIQLGAATLVASAGCIGDQDAPTPESPGSGSGGQPSPTDPGDGPTTTPGDLPTWEPAWSLSFDGVNGLGLDTADGLLYVTQSAEDGPSSVAAVDPDRQEVLWRTVSEGEAVGGSHATAQGIARGQWGSTLTDDSVYTVAGPAEEREWTALHALDRENGDRRWSLERERELGVAGVLDGLVVATGLEFFPGPGQTPVSHQTPEEPLVTVVYGVDPGDGTVRWTREFEGVADVAVSTDGVFVGTEDRLFGLDHEGTETFTDGHGPTVAVEAVPGRVYHLTGDPYENGPQTLHGVSPAGDRDWRHDLGVEELLLDGNRLYVGGSGGVAAVEPDGTMPWRDDDSGQWLLLDSDRDTLYTRSGRRADAATAYDTAGETRWTFDPPSNNAWPEAATADALMVTVITGDSADEPFKTVYAVDGDGEATAARGVDTVFDALGLDGTIYLTDGQANLLALEP